MAEYIDKEAAVETAIEAADEWNGGCNSDRAQIISGWMHGIKAADVVPRSVCEQAIWERNIVLEQLKQIGKGLGETMDDVVTVTRCKDCGNSYHHPENGSLMCWMFGQVEPTHYCGYAIPKEEEK